MYADLETYTRMRLYFAPVFTPERIAQGLGQSEPGDYIDRSTKFSSTRSRQEGQQSTIMLAVMACRGTSSYRCLYMGKLVNLVRYVELRSDVLLSRAEVRTSAPNVRGNKLTVCHESSGVPFFFVQITQLTTMQTRLVFTASSPV